MYPAANFKRLLLCTTSIMFSAGLGFMPAFAADPSATVSLGQTPTVQITAGSALPSQQDQSGQVTTNANANQIVVTATSGTGSGVFTNSTNAIAATATGNSLSLTDTLSSLASPDGLAFGFLQTDSAIVSALTQGNVIGINFDGLQSGSFSVTGNSLRSTASLNTTAITTSGTQELGYLTTATQNALARITGNEANRVVQATGSILVSGVQTTNVAANIAGEDTVAIVGGSGAAANVLSLNATSQTNNMLSAPLTLSTNTLAATFTGNQLSVNPRLIATDSIIEGTLSIAQAQSYDGNATSEQAVNAGSALTVTVAGANGTVNSFANGSVSMLSNSVSATATGNSATDNTTFNAGQSYAGPSAANRATIDLGTVSTVAGVSAEIANAASQYIGTSPSSAALIAAKTVDSSVRATLQGVSGSQVALGPNAVAATTTGNLLDTGIRAIAGSNVIDGSIALGSSQIIDAARISALVLNGTVGVSVGTGNTVVSDSAIRIGTNTSQARAYGQQATQTIALTAVSVPLSTETVKLTTDSAVTGTEKAVSASGAAVIATSQSNIAATSVAASNLDGVIRLLSQDMRGNAGSSLTVTANVQNSTAVADIASNSAAISATNAGYGLGVVTAQRLSDPASTVAATTTSTISLETAQLGNSALVTSAVADLTLNRTEAVAAGTSAANTVSLSSQRLSSVGQDILATKVAYGAGLPGSLAFSGGSTTPAVEAAVALLNEQTVDGTISATGSTNVKLDVAGSVSGSSVVRNNGNTLTLQAQGSVVSNIIGLTIPVIGISAGAYAAPIAALANVQATGANANFSAAMLETDQIENLSRVGGSVANSTLAQANNNLAAIADANRAGNALTVTANSILIAEGSAIAPTAGRTSSLNGVTLLDAAFTVLNAQSTGAPNGSSSVEATLRDPLDDSTNDGAQIATVIQGNINGSSVSTTTNVLRALANGNYAGTSTVVGNSLTLNTTSAQTTAAVANFQVANSDVLASIGFEGNRVISPTGTLNDGGFLISTGVGAAITDSILTMTGNTVTGSSFANTASSALTVTAASIVSDGSQDGASVRSSASGLELLADYAVLNNQSVGADAIVRSLVANSFGITSRTGTTVTNSTMNLSTNTQTSVATANYGSNALTLTGSTTDLGDGGPGAIGSSQSNASGGVTLAASYMDITAPMAGTGNVVTINGNRNAAAATINDVRNTLTASGNALGTSGIVALVGLPSNGSTEGDFVISNVQRAAAQGSVSSFTATQIFNQDFVNSGAETTNGSAITISNNITAADAIANRASNSLTATATGPQGSSAALRNDQANASNALASSANAIVLGLRSGTGSQISSSPLTLASNSSVATAGGNIATNALRLAGASLAPSQIGGTISSTSIESQAVVLNAQTNTGSITANSLGSVLNVLPGSNVDGIINNMAAVISGTTVAANAAGNSTNSTVTLNFLSTEYPSAVVSSVQNNSGAVSASATSTSLAVNTIAGANVGTVQITGTNITATAVGNSATLTIVLQ
jgi:hypothetical protein